jgi:hypothetical protein
MIDNMAHGGRIALLGIMPSGRRGRLEQGRLQHAHDPRDLRARDVRDLVQDDRHDPERARHLPGDHAPAALSPTSSEGFDLMRSGKSGKIILNWD